MNDTQRRKLNGFLVQVFNQILAWEEQTLKKTGVTDLSVRELHVIEAAAHLEGSQSNTMANIAKFISVSPGSLTTSVNVLVKKGYLERSYTPKDRRIIFINLTENGREVNAIHEQLHNAMCDYVAQQLTDDQLEGLINALVRLEEFFKGKNYTKS